MWRGINDSASPLQALSHATVFERICIGGWLTSADYFSWYGWLDWNLTLCTRSLTLNHGGLTWPYPRGLRHSTTRASTFNVFVTILTEEICFRRGITVLMQTPRIDPTSPERWLLWWHALSYWAKGLWEHAEITDQLFLTGQRLLGTCRKNWSVISSCIYTSAHAESLTLRLATYAQICKQKYIHAYKYIYTCTCIYIHTCMSVHIHTYTHTCTHMQHVNMHTRKHAWSDSAVATARRADADAGSSACLFCSTQSTTFSTSNARTLLYPLPETPIPVNPSSSLPNIPQNSSRTNNAQAIIRCVLDIARCVGPGQIMHLLSTDTAQDISGKVCTCKQKKLPTRVWYFLTSFSSRIATGSGSSLTMSSAFFGNNVDRGLHCSMPHFLSNSPM